MKKMKRGIDRGYAQEIVEEESSGAKKNREGYFIIIYLWMNISEKCKIFW